MLKALNLKALNLKALSLSTLSLDLHSAQPGALARATVRAFHLALLALVGPGLPLGGLYLLTRPAATPLWAVLGLALVALALGGAALRLSRRSARDPRLTPQQAALSAAMQLGSVPAAPFLLGCTVLNQPAALALLWGLALALYLYARRQLPRA